MDYKKFIKFVLKLLVSLAFVAWLVLKVEWVEVLAYVRILDAWEIGLYFAVVLFGIFVSASKWQFLAKEKGLNHPIGDFFMLYLTGTFINNFMPSTIGGDTYRAYAIGTKNKKYAPAAAAVVMDRLSGLFGAMFLALFFGALNWRETFTHPILVLIYMIVAGSLLSLFVLEKLISFGWLRKVIRSIPFKAKEFMQTLHEYYRQKKLFAKAISWSVLFALVGVGATNYILFWALGIKIDPLDYLSVIFLISIVSALPVSINNIGIKEWAYVTFFGFFGASVSSVVAVALISRFLQMMLSFLSLPYYLKEKETLRNK